MSEDSQIQSESAEPEIEKLPADKPDTLDETTTDAAVEIERNFFTYSAFNKATANGIAFSGAMLLCYLIQFLATILFLSAESIERDNWDILSALTRLKQLIILSFILMPIITILSYAFKRDHKFRLIKRVHSMQVYAFLTASILGILFYWPSYLA